MVILAGRLKLRGKILKRGAGILLAISSLPSDYGIGTLGAEAFHFVDLLVELRQRYWQVLPLGPTSYGDSPYQSFSAFAGNPYFIDLSSLIKEGLLTTDEVRAFNWGHDGSDVDYGILFENRMSVLKMAFARFDKKNKLYIEFCNIHYEWLDDFALFMALKEHFENKSWLDWEICIRNREPDALSKYKSELADSISFHCFCQYEFFKQWNRLRNYANKKGIKIIGDMPFYAALDSADVWVKRNQFLLNEMGNTDLVAGCPPDAFSGSGQRWGNPLYNWDYIEQNGFDWWQRRVKLSKQLFDIIRLDHFTGIVKSYAIPADVSDTKCGKWLKGPGKKIVDAIQEVIGDSEIIAENIGVFVPGANKIIQRAGWSQIKILLFAFDGNTGNEYLPHNYKDCNQVIYAGTHDNETISGYFKDKTEYELAFLYEYLNIKSKEEIPDALIRLAYSSIANVVIFQMQDILKLGNEARMNYPSTVGRNWRWRIWNQSISEETKEWIRTMSIIYRR